MQKHYAQQRKVFYKRALPVLAMMTFIIAITVEILYRMLQRGEITAMTSLLNWIVCITFVSFAILVKRVLFVSYFVAPILTIYCFYYFTYVDFGRTGGDIYLNLLIGISLIYVILMIFNEQWMVSTAVFVPCVIIHMKSTGVDYFEEPSFDVMFRAGFASVIYGTMAYKTEVNTKQSFTGKDAGDKAFNRWLKIFETFPEGIALIRSNYILYSNTSLKQLLELPNVDDDPFNEVLQQQLGNTKLAAFRGKAAGKSPANTTVWQFIVRKERGNTFELKSRAKNYSDDKAIDNVKYLTLNQVSVTIAGEKDKLLIIRDVTILMQQELIRQRKEQINIFTEELMKQVESYAQLSQTQLGRLDQFVDAHEGKQLLDETNNEVEKMLYRIRDFNNIYNVSEDRYKANPTGIHVKVSLNDVKQLIEQDLRNKNIDLNLRLAEDVPNKVTGDDLAFRQVILNVLTQTIAGCFRSVLTVQVEQKQEMGIMFLKIDIENFKSDIKRDEATEIADTCDYYTFLDVIESKTDLNVRIAKVLCDSNRWQMKFTFSRGTKFTFMIPIEESQFTQEMFDKARGKIKDDGLENVGMPKDAFTKVEALPQIGIGYDANEQDYEEKLPEVILLGTSEALEAVQSLDFAAEEAFLEDSAIRMIRQNASTKTPFRYVIMDLDDSTIDLARFSKNARAIAKEHQFSITIIGCGEQILDETKKLCQQHNIITILKPIEAAKLSTVLTKM